MSAASTSASATVRAAGEQNADPNIARPSGNPSKRDELVNQINAKLRTNQRRFKSTGRTQAAATDTAAAQPPVLPKPLLTSETREALKSTTPVKAASTSTVNDESSITAALAAISIAASDSRPTHIKSRRIIFKSKNTGPTHNHQSDDIDTDTENDGKRTNGADLVPISMPPPSTPTRVALPPVTPVKQLSASKPRRVPLIHRLRPAPVGDIVPLTSSSTTPAEEAAARLLQSASPSVLDLPLLPSDSPSPSPTSVTTASKKSLITVLLLCAELLSTERTYVTKLDELVSHYVTPLMLQYSKLGLSMDDVQSLFSYIQPIVDLHRKIVETMKSKAIHQCLPIIGAVTGDSNATLDQANASVSVIADTILSYGAYLKMYNHYVNNYNNSIEALQKLAENKKFTKFCQQAQPASVKNVGGSSSTSPTFDLQSYLIMPVQRIPRYEMLLSSMLKLIDIQWSAYQKLAEALRSIQSIASMINESKRAAENRLRMLEWKKRLKHFSSKELIAPHRRLLREDEINQLKPKNRSGIICILFNDALLLVNEASMKVKGWYLFDDLTGIRDYDSSGGNGNDSDYEHDDCDDTDGGDPNANNDSGCCLAIEVKATTSKDSQSSTVTGAATGALKRLSMAFVNSADTHTRAHTLVIQFLSEEEKQSWLGDVSKQSNGHSLIQVVGFSGKSEEAVPAPSPLSSPASSPTSSPVMKPAPSPAASPVPVPALPTRPRPQTGVNVAALIQQHQLKEPFMPALMLASPAKPPTPLTTPQRPLPARPVFVPMATAQPTPSSPLINELKKAILAHSHSEEPSSTSKENCPPASVPVAVPSKCQSPEPPMLLSQLHVKTPVKSAPATAPQSDGPPSLLSQLPSNRALLSAMK